MTRIEEIERTYCLKIGAKIRFCHKTAFRPNLIGITLTSLSGMIFLGFGKDQIEMEQNCVEVFEIHQHLHRNGLLTTKNLN